MFRLFIGACIAEVGGTIAGFGSSSIFLPIAHQFFTYQNTLILVAIYHIFGNLTRFSLFWKHWDKRIFILFGIPSIIATVIGAKLAGTIDPALLKLILGIILILFACISLIQPTIPTQVNPWIGRIGGALSGFTAGLIGTGGVLRGAFMQTFGLYKEAYIATIASVALLVDFTRIPVYFGQGFLDTNYLRTIPILFCIAFVGSWVGKCILAHIQTHTIRKVILVAIIIASGLLGWQGWIGL